MRGFFQARLHRKLFLWFGLTIMLMGAVTFSMARLVSDGPGWAGRAQEIEDFVAARFLVSWDNEPERNALAREIAAVFMVTVVLEDQSEQVLLRAGDGDCHSPWRTFAVGKSGQAMGHVRYCFAPRGHSHGVGAFLLLLAGTTLWIGTGFVAHRLARPLRELTQVARRIGEGELDARVTLRRRHRHRDEVEELTQAVNEMASRIQKQIQDQQELLAAVSHELRTPLGHLRMQLELMRDKGVTEKRLDGAEEEVLTLDRLIGELLVHSRLEFGSPQKTRLCVVDACELALRRSGVELSRLEDETDNAEFEADPTMLSSALCNLLNNAKAHAGGVERLSVRWSGEAGQESLTFSVEDSGPGFEPGRLGQVFQPFVANLGKQRTDGSGLGLGLSLVERIATAHGGSAWAENRTEPAKGARVSFSIRS